MSNKRLNRRLFIASTGAAAAIGSIGTGFLIAPDGAWAMSLTKLDSPSAKTLLRMARDTYPHDSIDDGPYAKVVEKLDQEAAKDPKAAQLLLDGVGSLNTAAGGSYVAMSEGKRVEILTSMEGQAFFQKVRGAMIATFYNDPTVWKKLGYQGSSAEFGGYLHRGFNDITWLPKA
jgi:hypothetical protein